MKNITDDFEVTPDGNMTYHGDKPANVSMIYNRGDSLVRASEEKSELCGANESLVNLNPKVVEPVDELVVHVATFTIDGELRISEWIEWEGGERPVDGDSEVAVKLRNGDTMTRRSTDLSWAHCPDGELDSSQDIIAYRPNYTGFLVNPMKDDGITYDRAVFDGVVADVSMFKSAPELYKALEEMCDMWTTVCDAQGWEPEHMVQYENALTCLAKARGECHE